jgi:tRNA dimethylallyltransferase
MVADFGHGSHGVQGAVLIAGPTASGKSALAMTLAERLGGVVINADSMQVYRDLRVITARPSAENEARVPHMLYGTVDAGVNYSVGHWLNDVAKAVTETIAAGGVPIVTGGTGLYFKILTSGLADVPPTPPQVRAGWRERLEREGIAALYAELRRVDPQSANRLMPNDSSRILRALEVMQTTGRSLRDWHKDGMLPLIDPAKAAKVFLTCERSELVNRIERRFDAVLAAGALEEVRALTARQLDPALPAMRAHGVPWLVRHLAGEIALEEATAGAKMDTRRYAKRQATWFRNQLSDWPWTAPDKALQALESQRAMV